MKVLVIGSGGREHALVWKIAQSPQVTQIYCAPGNGGIAELAEPVEINAEDVEALAEFAEDREVDLTVVGPEAALAKGIVDEFDDRDLKIFGPTKAAARLEASKSFAKHVMQKAGVPTAQFAVFDESATAKAYIKQIGAPCVVKADGLCGGKGAIVANTASEALGAVDLMMEDKIFKQAGERIVVEEMLRGEEASIIVVTDGKHIVPLAAAQDHKRIGDGDKGPNTGGMGAYSPAPIITDALMHQVMREIIQPTISELAAQGIRFRGVLYAGLMITPDGPKALEFNVRLGDPEAQVILPRLASDILPLLQGTVDGTLERVSLSWDARACVGVVLASAGYPGEYAVGRDITGLERLRDLPDVVCFHAGTKREGSGARQRLVTWGGRVLNVVALDRDIDSAIKRVYDAVEHVHFQGMQYRRDIGWHAVRQPQQRS